MPEESDRWLGSLWLLRPDFSWDGSFWGRNPCIWILKPWAP